jgi:MerR family copper efflux transcriptional regulator
VISPRPATDAAEKGLAIKEVTARAGVSERLVRYCEARGLISAAEEGKTSRHRYTHEDVSLLRFARRAHVLGFGMNEVARLLSLNSDVKRIALPQTDELESRIDELRATECILERLANLFAVEHQPACPILEELMELRASYALLTNKSVESD